MLVHRGIGEDREHPLGVLCDLRLKADDSAIINCLAVAPGRVLMPEGVSGHTMDRLGLHGVEVLTIPYDKVISGGGGLHCSTAPLIRDEV